MGKNVEFKRGTSQSSIPPCLQAGTFSIPEGSLVVVLASTAGGKSTFLEGLLGELPVSSGELLVRKDRRIGYVGQVLFLRNSTIRENILSRQTYREKRYHNNILFICGLLLDLKGFAAGDMTEIGSLGVNISGGQRARKALARTIYSEPDVWLLDEPFSAIDAAVGKRIFEDYIVSFMKGLTRLISASHFIIATYQTVDIVFILKDRVVVEAGSRLQLSSNLGYELSRLVSTLGALD